MIGLQTDVWKLVCNANLHPMLEFLHVSPAQGGQIFLFFCLIGQPSLLLKASPFMFVLFLLWFWFFIAIIYGLYLLYCAWRKLNSSLILSMDSPMVNLNGGGWGAWKILPFSTNPCLVFWLVGVWCTWCLAAATAAAAAGFIIGMFWLIRCEIHTNYTSSSST